MTAEKTTTTKAAEHEPSESAREHVRMRREDFAAARALAHTLAEKDPDMGEKLHRLLDDQDALVEVCAELATLAPDWRMLSQLVELGQALSELKTAHDRALVAKALRVCASQIEDRVGSASLERGRPSPHVDAAHGLYEWACKRLRAAGWTQDEELPWLWTIPGGGCVATLPDALEMLLRADGVRDEEETPR